MSYVPKSSDWCPYKRSRHRDTQRDREESLVKVEAETGVLLPRVRSTSQEPPGAGRGQEGLAGRGALLSP